MANGSPSRDDIERTTEEALFPAFVLGMVNVEGPIDDQDRLRAQALLKVTETRAALTAFLQGTAVKEATRMAGHTKPEVPMDYFEAADVKRLLGMAGQEGIPDEIWAIAQRRRVYAHKILRGELPPI